MFKCLLLFGFNHICSFWEGIWTFSHRVQCYSMSCGHLGFPIGIKIRNLVKDIPMIIRLQFGFSQFISFREEDLWNFSQSEHIIVKYCHHLTSVVCKLFTFQASSPKPLAQLEPNLAGMFLEWSSTNFLFFVPVGYSTWLPGPIIK
jgi:hypothetical protein